MHPLWAVAIHDVSAQLSVLFDNWLNEVPQKIVKRKQNVFGEPEDIFQTPSNHYDLQLAKKDEWTHRHCIRVFYFCLVFGF